MERREDFGRGKPLLVLVVLVLLMAAHHWWAATQGSVFFAAILGLPMLAGVALGGTVYPPVYFAITPRAREVPLGPKVAAVVLALAGLAAGAYVGSLVYGLF